MNLRLLLDDERGGVLVEAAITMALFIGLTFGVVEAGLVMWTLTGLQHGVEIAARCMTVVGASCTVNGTTYTCSTTSNGSPVVNVTNTQQCAAYYSYGVNPPSNIFTVRTPTSTPAPACGGNQVSASYTPPYLSILSSYFFKNASVTLQAQSCYPG